MSPKRLLPLVAAFVSLVFACKEDGSPARAQAHVVAGPERAASAATAAPAQPIPYPRAAWRLVGREELNDVVLWFSHILIRHDAAKLDEVSVSTMHWSSVAPPPGRTRAQAAALAEAIAQQAQNAPQRFGALAQRYSEDITTKDLGGSLGGMRARTLANWPELLDALAATLPGETSRPVETVFGYHVLYRAPPPVEDTVSGAHIVIGHDRAGWLPMLRGDAPAHRSRAEALETANRLYESLQRDPGQFEALVASHSEHPDRAQAGDFGSWSTRRASGYPREIEVLRQLQVGTIAPPMDSPLGIEILRRTADHPRRQYAMTGVWLRFDPSGKAGPNAQATVFSQAKDLAAGVAGDPLRFAALQRDVCCTFAPQWEEGQGSPSLTAALDPLAIGQVAPEPVQTEYNYVIFQRTEPRPLLVPEARFELPAHAPDIVAQLSNMQAEKALAELRLASEKAQKALGLDDALTRALYDRHAASRPFDDEAPPEKRRASVADWLLETEQLLGAERYARYRAILEKQVTEYLLGFTRPASGARPPG